MGDLKINGAIRKKGKTFMLIIYSSPFARYLISNGINEVDLNFYQDKIILSMGNIKKIVFEREGEKHPLAILYIGRLIPEELKRKVMENKKQVPIEIVAKGFISENELVNYNNRITRAEPQEYILKTPKSQLLKIGCFISVYRQNGKEWYRFGLRHRIVEDIVKSGKKVDLSRVGNEFFIKNNPKGNRLSLYKNTAGHSLAYMQISSAFLTNEEKKLFDAGRTAISSKAFLCEKDFGLDISEFFYDEKERTLAKALMKQGIEIRIPEMRKREADILLPCANAQIEVTTIMPVKIDKHKNNAHGEGIHINARLCEGYVRVMNNKINKFFVVMHKDWIEHQWVKDLYEMIKPKVVLIPTNFQGEWAENVVNRINTEIKNDKFN